jgi:SRSO17 transposase
VNEFMNPQVRGFLRHFDAVQVWDDQHLADIASAWAAGHLDDGDAVLIVDETADEKSSADCAGAARQYSGTAGGIALCQVAVTLTYATGRGHALIGRPLYLPEGCAADEEHCELAGVPEEVLFATGPQLAGALLDRAQSLGIRAAFVDTGLVPVTVPELLRLLRDVVIPPPRQDRAHRLHWPAWRRRQYRARQARQRWNAYAETAP